MSRIRQVKEVAILEFDGNALTDLMGALRSHVDDKSSANGQTVLVDLRDLQELSADGIETLTEAAIVCRDRGCDIGMFSLHEDVGRLLDALELGPHLPRVLPGDEATALAKLEEELAVPPVAAAPALPEAPPPAVELEFSFDAATAPTARFGPIPKGPEAYAEQESTDLLRINWSDLVKTGYQINGDNSAAIHAAVSAEVAAPAPAVEEAYSPLDTVDLDKPPLAVSQAAAEQPPTRPMVMSMPKAEPEAPPTPAPAPAPTPALAPTPAAQPHPAVMAYAEEPGDGEDQTVMFQPGADFAAQLAAATAAPATADGEDQTIMFQPNAALAAELAQASQDLERSQSREGPPPEVVEAPAPAGAFADPGESDEGNQTVMFQPGVDLAAELARLEAADAARAAAEVAETERTHSPAYARDAESEDQTIMFQPGALDAALLAEVAAAAGPEPTPEPPPVQPAPTTAQVRQANLGLNGDDAELRVFLHDYALQTPLHLELLVRFAQAGERALGPSDLRSPGSSGGRVTDVVDQFVQCRLVRRTRAPRVRGGTGFLFSPSPRVGGLINKLLKLWQAPGSRATVSSWLDS